MSRLKLFRITGDLKNLDKSLQIMIELSGIYPIKSSEFINRVHGLTAISTDNSYIKLFQEIEAIEADNAIAVDPHKFNPLELDSDSDKIEHYVHHIHESLSSLLAQYKKQEQEKGMFQDTLTQLNSMAKLDVSLDTLLSCEYICIRFGKLPKDSVEILKMYDKIQIYYELFEEEETFYWCMYMTTVKHEKEVDNIFSSLNFERIHISNFVHGTPKDAIASLKEKIQETKKNVSEIKQKIDDLIMSNMERLSDIKGYLIYLDRINEAKKYVVGLGNKFNITGFILENDVDSFKHSFRSVEGIEIDIMPVDFDKRLKPPRNFKKYAKDFFKSNIK